MWLVPPRAWAPELMDRPDNSRAELEAAFADLERVNRWLGGRRTLIDSWLPLLSRVEVARPVEVLDVGTGDAGLAQALVQAGARAGRQVRVVAVDCDPVTADIAARRTADEPAVQVVRADARCLPFARRSFDFVTASLFLHHFRDDEAVALLRGFLDRARVAVLINDLRRHRLPWAFIAAVGWLTRRHALFRHDAPLSVLRGFTAGELARLGQRSGAPRVGVRRRWPFRLALTLEAAR